MDNKINYYNVKTKVLIPKDKATVGVGVGVGLAVENIKSNIKNITKTLKSYSGTQNDGEN